MEEDKRRFYVYMWYFKNTNKVFHIGKGTGNRYKNTSTHRNKYFKNIIAKYKNEVDVRIYEDNLTEQEAWDLEKKLIILYKSEGECETNFHEGGCGGFTGNYNNPERSRKISESASKRVGKLNPMYNKHHSEKTKQILSQKNKGKKLTKDHIDKLIKSNLGRKKTEKELDFIKNLNKGKPMSKEIKDKMMDSLCPFEYIIMFNNVEVYRCLGHTELYKYCKKTYNISRTIIEQIINKTWIPKFTKHKYLAALNIIKIERCID